MFLEGLGFRLINEWAEFGFITLGSHSVGNYYVLESAFLAYIVVLLSN